MFLLPQLNVIYNQAFQKEYKQEQQALAKGILPPETQIKTEKNLEDGTLESQKEEKDSSEENQNHQNENSENTQKNNLGSRILKNVFKNFEINYRQTDVSFEARVEASFENGRQILARNITFGVPTSINKVRLIKCEQIIFFIDLLLLVF